MTQLPPGFVLDGAPQQAGPVYGPPAVPKQPAPVDPLIQRKRELDIVKAERDLSKPADGDKAPSGYRFTADGGLEPIPGGPADKPENKSGLTANKQSEMKDMLTTLDQFESDLSYLEGGFKSLFENKGIGTPLEYLPTPEKRAFNDAGERLLPLVAKALGFTAKQMDTPAEIERLRRYVPDNWDSDVQIQRKLEELRGMLERQRANLSSQIGVSEPERAFASDGITPQGGAGYGSENPTPPTLSPGPERVQAAEGYRTEQGDPAIEAEYRERLASGQGAGEIIPWLRSTGAGPQTLIQAVKQIQYRDENPNVPIDKFPVSVTGQVPLSTFEQVTTDIGQTAPGAYAIGAGQFLSGNTLDNLTSDPERARLAMEVARAESPTATTLGELSGGVMAALSGEAGLARLGVASGIGRAALADTAMGAATGAGAADDGNRLTGAAQGGLAAGAGSLGGSLAMRGASRALSPSGGSLSDLYAQGIRPTPGQRLIAANDGQGVRGVLGRAVNATEEAAQSIPIVGAAVSGARQEARDQFQRAAFNQSLQEIGLELPEGVSKGAAAHKFAQKAFNDIYDEARSGMRVVPDEELANDLNALGPDIQTLGPAAQRKLKAIMDNTMGNDLVGDGYKRAMSDLGKHSARLRRSTMGEEQQLADVLEGIQRSLDSAARRHSDPDAVKLMDAADAGYAKLVRIEEAAKRRGGDAGEFSPNAFDSSVQKSSGGVRSKAYLRGEALMQDFAQQGKALEDRLPNSGTTDRALQVGGLATAGAGYFEPSVAAVLGSLGFLYAPGVRKATKGAFAPSSGKRKAIAEKLKRIERLTSAATGAAGAQAAIPSQ